MDSATCAITVSGVSLTRGGRALLRGIDVATPARRIGIVGRNGSGKTTLARVLCGLIAPDTGTVRVCGVDVVRDRRAALRTVGILFQNPDHQIIFPTVEEELAFGLTQLGQTKAQVQAGVTAILSRFGRAHWRDAAIHTMSHGQKQLVCLMAVLVMEPRVVVLDEPFSGLDLPTRMQLTAAFAGITAGIVHITHDPDIVRDYDHVIWMDGGRVAMQGDAGPVLDAYVARMTALGAGDDLTHLAG